MTTPAFALPDPMIDLSVTDMKEHSLKDFLSRPILIDSPTWSTARAAGYTLNAYNFPEQLLANSMFLAKITNFYGFRASMVFRLVINTERYQQGRLILSWFPQGQVNTVKYAQSVSHLCYVSQLPRVDFDVSADTAVTLKVPFASPFSHYCVPTGVGPFGVATLTVYSPLVTPTGTNNLAVQLWAWCEDVELVYPARPQSAFSVSTRRSIVKPGPKEEVQKPGLSSFSQMLGGAVGVAVKSNVPVLSSLLSVPNWVADFAKGAAYSFGASKPLNSTPPAKMVQENFGGQSNVDYVDTSASLGLSSQNAVTPLSRFVGSSEDEMAFQSILRIPTYYAAASWAVDSAQDTILWESDILPSAFYVADTSGGVGYAHTTPLSYFKIAFDCWRGSVNLTFKFVKTEFHSGRLLFTFDPGPPAGAITVANSCSLYREVIDIRMCNEYTVTVPFVSIRPWLRGSERTGRAYLIVESKLRAPTSVSQSISVLTEVSAGPDFEFAVPQGIETLPAIPGITPGLLDSVEEVAFPEALGMDVSEQTTSSRIPAMSPLGAPPVIGNVNSAICIGESIRSLRQLLKKYCAYFCVDDAYGGFEFKPSIMRINTFPVAGNLTTAGTIDYLDFFGLCFGYQRGGIRIRVTSVNSSVVVKNFNTTIQNGNTTYSSPGQLTNATALYQDYCLNNTIHTQLTNNGVQVQVPFYSTTHCKMNKIHGHAVLLAYDEYEPGTSIVVAPSDYTMAYTRMYRAVADDFSLGFFLCTLPVVGSSLYKADTYKFKYN